ncbi:MAG: hypothetical protein KF789_01690, partial [Bdellovibrionaceae bacterium]|nr:hypothetical protein [Pseudobdellovibrionaceae bacterium]
MKIILSVLVFFALSPFAWSAEFPAHWKFKTLHTPHFDIIVNAEQQDMGQFYAKKLEKAYALVTPLFTDVPERVTIVLADKTDLTNGYATRMPYPHMFFFPVQPGPQESIGETGDWALELAIHELTHILTFEAVSGVMEPLQSIFGSILSPNLLLPGWWKEGVAVQTETQLSHGGRLRSAYQDGVLRSLFTEGKVSRFDIATINERVPFWTEGMSAYLFGSVFWSEAVAEKGSDVIDQLHQSHGGRVPYAIGAPAMKYLGSGYQDFYKKAIQATETRVQKQMETLQAAPLTPGESLRIKTHYTQGGRISPNGDHLALISIDETDRRAIRIFRRAPGREDFVDPIEDLRFVNRREQDVLPAAPDAPPSGSISRVSWFPDGSRLVFDKVDWVSRYESYSDLWIFDIEKEKSEQLTRGLRAREPFAAKDGKTLYYIQLEGSRSALAKYDLETKTSTVLWKGRWQDRLSFPVELEDGSVVFSVRGEDGWEGLRRLRTGETSPEIILDDYKDARFPELSKDGLVFTSSQNGVHNLYLSSADFLAARPLTHVVGSAFSSGTDPKTGDVYATLMTGEGLQVRKIAKTDSQNLPQVLPAISPLFGDRYPKSDRAAADPEVPVEISDYAPGSYLLPRYWIPFVSLSAVNNSLVIEASTAGFDPLKKHIYSLSAGWDSGVQEASYMASYQNNVLPHSLNFASYRTASYLVSIQDPLFNEGGSISITPDVFKISRYFNMNLGMNYRKTSYGTANAERIGPSLLAQYADFGKSGTQIS